MKLFQKQLLLLLGIFIASSAYGVQAKRPWTFVAYIAADNNLNPEADLNISQMVKASATHNVYIIVYLNIKRDGQDKLTQKLIIQDGKISIENIVPAQDSGDENTFLKALVWAVTEFPSDHLFVDIWNHGSGSLNRNMHEMYQHRGVCYDDSTGNYLTDMNVKHVLDIIVNQYLAGRKIDIIAFDACLMADIEIAFTLMPYAHHLISSQETVPGAGFNYTSLLTPFLSANPDAITVAKNLVSSYNAQYKYSGQSYTLSAINLDKFGSVVSYTNSIAQLLNKLLATDKKGSLERVITASANSRYCLHFDEPTYIDLYSFYTNIYNRISSTGLTATNQAQLKTALRNALSALSQSIYANVKSTNLNSARGVSIYFADLNDGIEASYKDLYWSQLNPQWLQFLTSYVNAAA